MAGPEGFEGCVIHEVHSVEMGNQLEWFIRGHLEGSNARGGGPGSY